MSLSLTREDCDCESRALRSRVAARRPRGAVTPRGEQRRTPRPHTATLRKDQARMVRRFRTKSSVVAALGVSIAAIGWSQAAYAQHRHAHTKYEVWLVDQSDSFGSTYGGNAYVFQGKHLEGANAANAPAERIDL